MASDKLAVLKQGAHQPVTQYVGQVQQLLIKIPDMDMGSRVRGFIRGLLPHLAQKLREGRPKTASEAYEMAIRMEGSFGTTTGQLGKEGGRKSHGGMGKTQSISNVEAEEQEGDGGIDTSGTLGKEVTLAAIQRIIDQRWGGQNADSGQRSTNDVCFNCGVQGHYSRECPKPRKQRLCYRCKKPGHMKAECPERKTTGGGAGAPGGQSVKEK
jgi:hypothetical protein